MTAREVPAAATAASTDPLALGWMVGSPPPKDKLIQPTHVTSNGIPDHFIFPKTRWAFSNMQKLVVSAPVYRADGPPSALPVALRDDLDAVTYTPLGATDTRTWTEFFDASFTDAVLVMHKGTIVYEKYFHVMGPQRHHTAFSVTKSFFATIAACLILEGVLDETALVSKYIPELKNSAFGDATVRNVLDMRVGVAYSEDYADPKAEVWDGARASGVFPRPPGYSGPMSTYEFLASLKKEGEHGRDFFYKTPCTDVVGWLLCRVTGKSLSDLLTERLWKPLGMERDAALWFDPEGTEHAGGGLQCVLRDLARMGEMMRLRGVFNGARIVPEAVIEDIEKNGDPAAFKAKGPTTIPGGAYRTMWWILNDEHKAYMARGIHGQAIYINPTAELVITRFGSHPVAGNAAIDPEALPAYRAIANHLMTAK